jgi:hypothetical protein
VIAAGHIARASPGGSTINAPKAMDRKRWTESDGPQQSPESSYPNDGARSRARFVEVFMCMMCDGATLDECRLEVHRCITTYGWFVQAIEAGAHNPDWA